MKTKTACALARPMEETTAEPHTAKACPAAAARIAPGSSSAPTALARTAPEPLRGAFAEGLGQPHDETGGRSRGDGDGADPTEPEGVHDEESGLEQSRQRRRRSQMERWPGRWSRRPSIRGGGERHSRLWRIPGRAHL